MSSVVLPGFSIDPGFCGNALTPGSTRVEFHDYVASSAGLPLTATTIDGVPARRGGRASSRGGQVIVTFPDKTVTVTIDAPTLAGAEALARTISLPTTDEHGCAVRQRPARLSAPTGAAVLGTRRLTSLTLCRYYRNELVLGATLDGPAAAVFRSKVHALPTKYEDGRCSFLPDGQQVVLRGTYTSGRALVATGTPGANCDFVRITNGTVMKSADRQAFDDVVSRAFEVLFRPGGTVIGILERVGGPYGTPNVRVPGTIVFTSPALTTTAGSGEDGSFRIVLPPGRYTVTGASPQVGGTTCTAPPVTVTEVGALPLDVVCSIP